MSFIITNKIIYNYSVTDKHVGHSLKNTVFIFLKAGIFMFKKGNILTGAQWNEPIEVIDLSTEENIGYLVKARGLKTSLNYQFKSNTCNG